ncbi:hypothetical protein FEM48_Zijuj01G0212600 [Ziziphus jujuba var. spinosa]|uniref:Fibronectin type III-like domain-containing protein n=1 Tax=Ziziphus jujuba var. spinosa TaxID=714518 RepID=A0A978W3L5_ZIZJJ|nr:hypothetical protein FEM48_Zijuj01G0212600 [Ziziphus jujuba var. spinosa]
MDKIPFLSLLCLVTLRLDLDCGYFYQTNIKAVKAGLVFHVVPSTPLQGLQKTVNHPPTRCPMLLAMMNNSSNYKGGRLDRLCHILKDKHIDAILWVGYPGQAGGAAIAMFSLELPIQMGHTPFLSSHPPAGTWSANKHLVGFQKVHVAVGSVQRVTVGVDVCKHLSVVDKSGVRTIPLGEHQIHIGGDGVGDLKHSISLHAGSTNIKS